MARPLNEKDQNAPSLIEDVVRSREEYVHAYITQRVMRREGDFTNADYDRWEGEAHTRWREKYPAFTSLLPSHLPVTSPDSTSEEARR